MNRASRITSLAAVLACAGLCGLDALADQEGDVPRSTARLPRGTGTGERAGVPGDAVLPGWAENGHSPGFRTGVRTGSSEGAGEDPPRAWTDLAELRMSGAAEREYMACFESLLRQDPERFRREAEAILRHEESSTEKRALLRVAHDRRPELSATLFPLAAYGGDERLAEFVVRHLGRIAPRDAGARDALARVTFGDPAQLFPATRRRAAAYLGAACTEEGVDALALFLATEEDGDVREAALVGLLEHHESRVVDELCRRHGLDPESVRASAGSNDRSG